MVALKSAPVPVRTRTCCGLSSTVTATAQSEKCLVVTLSVATAASRVWCGCDHQVASACWLTTKVESIPSACVALSGKVTVTGDENVVPSGPRR